MAEDKQIKIKFRMEIDKEQLVEFLNSHPRLQPVQCGFSVDHSEYIEYGTGPARGRSQYWIGEEGRKALDEWAKIKLNMKDDAERAKFVQNVIFKIYKHGMKPKPFFRTAQEQVKAHIQSLFDEGKSMFDIGDKMGDIAKQEITRQNIFYTGAIVRSWFINTLQRDESALDIPAFRSLKEEV